MSPAAEIQLWMRQPRETRKAFHAFSIYRDLGVKRSIDKAYTVFWLKEHQPSAKTTSTTKVEPPPNAPRHWGQWSIDYRWVERAAAFDADIDRRAQEAFENELVMRRQQALRDEYDAAMAQLDLWRLEYESAVESHFDLKSLNVLGRLRTTLNAQRRLALGMPTTSTDLTTGGEKLPGNTVLNIDDLADVFKEIHRHKEAQNDAGS